MSVPIAFISAFLNNTPVVAIMIPILLAWSAKAGLAPGHLFMPLSFASILGGTVTLIGTSTNLVVSGKQSERFPDQKPIGIFDLTPYGVPVAIAGIVYMVAFGPKLLPGAAKKKQTRVPTRCIVLDRALHASWPDPATGQQTTALLASKQQPCWPACICDLYPTCLPAP